MRGVTTLMVLVGWAGLGVTLGQRIMTRMGNITLTVDNSATVAAVRGLSERVDVFELSDSMNTLHSATSTLSNNISVLRDDVATVISNLAANQQTAIEGIQLEAAENSSRLLALIDDQLRNLTADLGDSLATTTAALNARVDPLLVCARQGQILGPDGSCFTSSAACPSFQLSDLPNNMTATMEPEYLAYERLPGTMVHFRCPSGHAPPPQPAICLRNGSWGLAGIPPPACISCASITDNCVQCNTTHCLECRDGTILTSNHTCGRPQSCRDVEESGTYLLENGAQVYCFISDGKHWTKISAWGSSYPLTTGARNAAACASARGSNCKLSDSVINSLVSGDRIYRLEASGRSSKMYLYTGRPYIDTQRSWNIAPNSGSTRGIVASSYPGDNRLRNGGRFRSPWVDFLYINGYGRGESCERYFIGHGNVDCYGTGSRVRCIRGGGSCGGYRFISNWQMYIADL